MPRFASTPERRNENIDVRNICHVSQPVDVTVTLCPPAPRLATIVNFNIFFFVLFYSFLVTQGKIQYSMNLGLKPTYISIPIL